jgi:hypothetical protein
MTERSWYWSGISTGDAALAAPYGAPYTDDMFSDLWALLFTSDRTAQGVLLTSHASYSGLLAVTNPSGTTIRVATGAALVDGKLYASDAVVDLSTSGDGSYSVVLRKTWATQTVRAAIRSLGVTQTDGTIWEIELARVVVASGVHTVTDMREFVQFSGTPATLEDGFVTTDMLADLAVTEAKLGAAAVTATKIDDGAVTRNKVALNAVGGSKLYWGAPRMTERIGNLTFWATPGTTERTVYYVKMVPGCVEVTIASGFTLGSVTVNLTTPFYASPPIVFLQDVSVPVKSPVLVALVARPVSTSSFEIYITSASAVGADTTYSIAFLAISDDNIAS